MNESFWRGLAIQARVTHALLMREIMVRFGRQGLAIGWIVGEPLVFAIPVLVMWSYLRPATQNGLSVMALAWSGYLPLMLFRHVVGVLIRPITVNQALMYHRLVTPFDILVSKMLLEIGQNILGLAFSFVMLYAVDAIDYPADLAMFYVGYLYMIWWCVAIGIFIGALSERSEWVEKIWFPVSYMYIAIGGCFYMADWLPTEARWVALFQPSLQAYEMIRAGVFGTQVVTHYDLLYTTGVLALLTLFGLVFLRQVRRYIQIT